MGDPILRPPLPPPLSHDGIVFTLDTSTPGSALSEQTVAAIAASLHALLPGGDFTVDASGLIITRHIGALPVSLWHQAGLLEGIERSSL